MNKSELEIEREQALLNQWVELTEERNAVSIPKPNSGIPGAPADWYYNYFNIIQLPQRKIFFFKNGEKSIKILTFIVKF